MMLGMRAGEDPSTSPRTSPASPPMEGQSSPVPWGSEGSPPVPRSSPRLAPAAWEGGQTHWGARPWAQRPSPALRDREGAPGKLVITTKIFAF